MTTTREHDNEVAFLAEVLNDDRGYCLDFHVKDSIDRPGNVVLSLTHGEDDIFVRITPDDAINFGAALVKVALYAQEQGVADGLS